MNKKQIAAKIEATVAQMVEAKGCTEETARGMLWVNIEENLGVLANIETPKLTAEAA